MQDVDGAVVLTERDPPVGGAKVDGAGNGFGPLIGISPPMKRVYALIQRVAPTDATAIVTGESGAGKELVARAVHDCSGRSGGAFIAINCGAIPDSLIEAELFGHERGSFTGAHKTHHGVFERARGGTLFLDEITEMSLKMQTRLLRVLQTQRFYRVGGTSEVQADVRIVAATNRNVTSAVQMGHLRADLLYRLAVFPIHVPPLRTRGDDVMLLAEHFLRELNDRSGQHKRFAPGIDEFLFNYSWPGNVRELRNCVERAYIMSDDEIALDESLLMPLPAHDEDEGAIPIRIGTCLADVEKQLIVATLEQFAGNKRRAAEVLGCSVKTLYNKLNGYRADEAGGSNAASAPAG